LQFFSDDCFIKAFDSVADRLIDRHSGGDTDTWQGGQMTSHGGHLPCMQR